MKNIIALFQWEILCISGKASRNIEQETCILISIRRASYSPNANVTDTCHYRKRWPNKHAGGCSKNRLNLMHTRPKPHIFGHFDLQSQSILDKLQTGSTRASGEQPLAYFISTIWKGCCCGAILPLFILFLAPAFTQASCGDYVTKAGQKSEMKDHADQVPSRLCTGLSCSKGPGQQPLTNSPLPNPTQQDTGILLPADRLPTFSPIDELSDEDSALQNQLTANIFHPPRHFTLA